MLVTVPRLHSRTLQSWDSSLWSLALGLASVIQQLKICHPVPLGQRLTPKMSSLLKNLKTGRNLKVQDIIYKIRSILLPPLELRLPPADKAD